MQAQATSNLDQKGGARPGGARGPVVLSQGAGLASIPAETRAGLGKISKGISSVAGTGATEILASEGLGAESGAWRHPQ